VPREAEPMMLGYFILKKSILGRGNAPWVVWRLRYLDEPRSATPPWAKDNLISELGALRFGYLGRAKMLDRSALSLSLGIEKALKPFSFLEALGTILDF